jgi:hypothetical protein
LVRLIESDPKQFRLDPRQRLVFRRDLADPVERLAYVERLIPRLAGARLHDKPAAAQLKRGMAQ